MEHQQQLDPLINAAVLTGDDVVHQMRMQQQPPINNTNGAGQRGGIIRLFHKQQLRRLPHSFIM